MAQPIESDKGIVATYQESGAGATQSTARPRYTYLKSPNARSHALEMRMGRMATSSWIAPSGQTDAQKTRPKNSENTSGRRKNITTASDTPTLGSMIAAATFWSEPTGQMQPLRQKPK